MLLKKNEGLTRHIDFKINSPNFIFALHSNHTVASHYQISMTTLELEARLDNLLSTAQIETADINIFAPIAEREECPICLIPLPINVKEITFMSCCGKRICFGCTCKHAVTDVKNGAPLDEHKCAFCQQIVKVTAKIHIKRLKKLMKKNIPKSFIQMANRYKTGTDGVLQSDTRVLEMYIRAAELGDTEAYCMIGSYYHDGVVIGHDMSKALEYDEVAAKKGCIPAHKRLAGFHGRNGNIRVCMKHLKVAACAGDQDSMDNLMNAYKDKLISKEELTQTLHAFQASNNEIKSEDRDDARVAKARFDEAEQTGSN